MTTSLTVTIPDADGSLRELTMSTPGDFARPVSPSTSRQVFAAPHVVADALADYIPGIAPRVDWDQTMAYRRHLWSYGIGVAEAMDTSERGPGGLTWAQTKELITRSVSEASAAGGRIVAGAGTDQLPTHAVTLAEIADAYVEQVLFIQSLGCATVLRASHALAAVAVDAADYAQVYDKVLESVEQPAIIHWIGEVFDPALASYWGSSDVDQAAKCALELANRHPEKIAGFKFSLLDRKREVWFRNELPGEMMVLTGDDHDYPSLIAGDVRGHSHALLGVFDPLAPIASTAFQALDTGDVEQFRQIMDSTVPLARRVFERPAGEYKTGVVLIAHLAGHQDHFRMITGREGMRSTVHLADVFAKANALGLFPDPALAAHRMRHLLALAGVPS